MTVTIVDGPRPVTGGVDTHLDLNVAAALDGIGGLLGVESFPTSRDGHAQLYGWLCGLGRPVRVGVEGTGSYGAGIARFLAAQGVEVVEVDRPNRQARRKTGKSDPADAIEAARAALSGRAAGQPKSRDGNIEAIRALVVARRSARDAKIAALNQIRHLGFCGPEDLRERLAGVPRAHLGELAASLRPRTGGDPVIFATKTAINVLGRRIVALDAERAMLDALLAKLVAATAPDLLAVFGVGVDVAASLLVTAGDNVGRIRTEAGWARLCGVAPLEASSGKTARHRLSRGGDRQANAALYVVVITRMRNDPRTQTYVTRRLAEGKTKPEIIRILKRYVAREVYHHLPRTGD